MNENIIPTNQLVIAVAAGVASVLLYLFSIQSGFFSILISYLPYLPLFIGLGYGVRLSTIAGLSAVLLAGLVSGFAGMTAFAILYAFPTMFFVNSVLNRSLPVAYPVGGALTGLTLYGAAISFLLVFTLFSQPDFQLQDFLPDAQQGHPEWMNQGFELIAKMPYFMVAAAVWLQVAMIYGCAVLSNFLIAGWQPVIRPTLRLEPFMPSALMLLLLLGCGLMSFNESMPLQIASKASFIILLLPYFLMGVVKLHRLALRWKHPVLLLSVIYVLTILVFWPVFWFILSGLYLQAKFLSNRLPSGGGTDG